MPMLLLFIINFVCCIGELLLLPAGCRGRACAFFFLGGPLNPPKTGPIGGASAPKAGLTCFGPVFAKASFRPKVATLFWPRLENQQQQVQSKLLGGLSEAPQKVVGTDFSFHISRPLRGRARSQQRPPPPHLPEWERPPLLGAARGAL